MIDPYELLGVTYCSTIKQLKDNYYNLALYCHPDKGGDIKDMIILSKSYKYIKKELDIKKECILEKEFKNFCKNEKNKVPSFEEIYKETNNIDFNKKFNEEFDKLNINDEKYEEENNIYYDPFKLNGYGKYMDKSEIKIFYNSKILEEKKVNKFEKKIIIYKEPYYYKNTYNNIPLNIKDIKDYSHKKNNLNMFDYKKSFTEINLSNIKLKTKTLDELIKERENLEKNIIYENTNWLN